jgi:hypothetical protein
MGEEKEGGKEKFPRVKSVLAGMIKKKKKSLLL